jgi:hypothetical protein
MLAMLRNGTNQMEDARTIELEERVRTFKAVWLGFWLILGGLIVFPVVWAALHSVPFHYVFFVLTHSSVWVMAKPFTVFLQPRMTSTGGTKSLRISRDGNALVARESTKGSKTEVQ